MPGADFTPAITAISSYFSGGRIDLRDGRGRRDRFWRDREPSINGLLAGLDVPMTLEQRSFDLGLNIAAGTQFAMHPLTNGAGGLTYGATTSVVGGTPLYFTINHTPFIAVVPEPAMLLSVVLVVGTSLMRNRGRSAISNERAH